MLWLGVFLTTDHQKSHDQILQVDDVGYFYKKFKIGNNYLLSNETEDEWNHMAMDTLKHKQNLFCENEQY